MPRTRAIFLAVAALTGLVRCTSFEPSTPVPDASVAPPLPDPSIDTDAEADTGAPAIVDAGVDELAPPIDAGPCGHCRSKHCQDGGGCDPLVFISSDKYRGDLEAVDGGKTGIARGDEICQQLGGSPGIFRAWLSDSTKNAVTHVSDGAVTNRPLWLTDGSRVAVSLDDLVTRGFPAHAIDRTAAGGFVPNATSPAAAYRVWTATVNDGTASALSCSQWSTSAATVSGHFGLVQANKNWTVYQIAPNTQPCNGTGHIYCFEFVAAP